MNSKRSKLINYFKDWSQHNLDKMYYPYTNNLFSSSIVPFFESNLLQKNILSRYILNKMSAPRYLMGEGESIHRIFGYNRKYCIDEALAKNNKKFNSNFNKQKFKLGIIPFIQEILIELIAFIFTNIYFILIFIIIIFTKKQKKRLSKFDRSNFIISIARSPTNKDYLYNLKNNYLKENQKLLILKFFGWTSFLSLIKELIVNRNNNIFYFGDFYLKDLISCYLRYINFVLTKPSKKYFKYLDLRIDLGKSLRHIRLISLNTIIYEKLLENILKKYNANIKKFISLELKTPIGFIERSLCNKYKIKNITIQTCDLDIDSIINPPWENDFFCESKKLFNDLRKINIKKIKYSGSLRFVDNINYDFNYKPKKIVFCTSPRSVFKNFNFIKKLLNYSKNIGIEILILPHPRDFYLFYKLLFFKQTITNTKKNDLFLKEYLFITFPSAIIYELIYYRKIFMVANLFNDKELYKQDFYDKQYIGFEQEYGTIFDQIEQLYIMRFDPLVSSYKKYLNILEKNDIIPKKFKFIL